VRRTGSRIQNPESTIQNEILGGYAKTLRVVNAEDAEAALWQAAEPAELHRKSWILDIRSWILDYTL
jgi:hypothetical protein